MLASNRGLIPYEDRRLLEFAIYRVGPNRFDQERSEAFSKKVEEVHDGASPPSERILHLIHQGLEDEYGMYAYNQVVGWARLCVTGIRRIGSHATIKGYYSRRNTSRITRNSRAKFAGTHKFTEFGVYREESREEICEKIRMRVGALTRQRGVFRGRYVDFEILDSLGPWIDWHALLDIGGVPSGTTHMHGNA
jgi:hypothetical protein